MMADARGGFWLELMVRKVWNEKTKGAEINWINIFMGWYTRTVGVHSASTSVHNETFFISDVRADRTVLIYSNKCCPVSVIALCTSYSSLYVYRDNYTVTLQQHYWLYDYTEAEATVGENSQGLACPFWATIVNMVGQHGSKSALNTVHSWEWWEVFLDQSDSSISSHPVFWLCLVINLQPPWLSVQHTPCWVLSPDNSGTRCKSHDINDIKIDPLVADDENQMTKTGTSKSWGFMLRW